MEGRRHTHSAYLERGSKPARIEAGQHLAVFSRESADDAATRRPVSFDKLRIFLRGGQGRTCPDEHGAGSVGSFHCAAGQGRECATAGIAQHAGEGCAGFTGPAGNRHSGIETLRNPGKCEQAGRWQAGLAKSAAAVARYPERGRESGAQK